MRAARKSPTATISGKKKKSFITLNNLQNINFQLLARFKINTVAY